MNIDQSVNRKSFLFLSSLFFMWGFITVTNDILINTFKGIFDLTAPQRSLVQSAFFGAFFIISLIYFLLSTSTGRDPINRIGYKNGMAISLAVCGMGCLMFYPAAHFHSYAFFLSALFVLASGVTLLQICANPYATILGPPESASSRLNRAQGLNSLGTTLGPLVGTILIYQVFSKGNVDVNSVSDTYVLYGFVFLGMALFTFTRKMPTFKNTEIIEKGLAVLKNRHLFLGVLAIFFYVGSEVAVGSWVVEFIRSDKIMGLGEAEASYFLSYFWGGLMIGRLLAGISLNNEFSVKQKAIRMAIYSITTFFLIYVVTAIKFEEGHFTLRFLEFSKISLYLLLMVINYSAFFITFNKPARALVVFSLINAVLISVAILGSGHLAFWCLLGSGLFFSVGWSNIFSLAIRGLGKLTSQGSSLLVMAIVGGAVLPGIQSFIIEGFGVQISFLIPLLGMIYLIFYGLNGYKSKSELKKS
ncbi:MAG: sugar MFS transporter [Saprospiraceae bacterium]|nr:sugar MFS transporter [Saprospiraceae bacterium]MCB9322531.1 sugar MFS transporter [Lewinellaceae bacterium]